MYLKRFSFIRSAVLLVFLLMSFELSSKNTVSLMSRSVRYLTSESSQWTEWSEVTIPIVITDKEITFGSVPLGKFKILSQTGQASGDSRNATYKCKNAKGTVFTVKVVYSSATNVVLDVENASVKMSYKCSVANEKPYYNMVDLGLSCKWGMSNYYNYSTDIVSATFGSGKRLSYDEAIKVFASGKQHLPSTKQIKELLTKCSWDFIDNPDDDFHKGYLVTGPNGNSIFLPCNDGGDGRLSSAWYLGSDSFDAFLSDALQLNINSRVVHPFEKNYFGCIRLVEDK